MMPPMMGQGPMMGQNAAPPMPQTGLDPRMLMLMALGQQGQQPMAPDPMAMAAALGPKIPPMGIPQPPMPMGGPQPNPMAMQHANPNAAFMGGQHGLMDRQAPGVPQRSFADLMHGMFGGMGGLFGKDPFGHVAQQGQAFANSRIGADAQRHPGQGGSGIAGGRQVGGRAVGNDGKVAGGI